MSSQPLDNRLPTTPVQSALSGLLTTSSRSSSNPSFLEHLDDSPEPIEGSRAAVRERTHSPTNSDDNSSQEPGQTSPAESQQSINDEQHQDGDRDAEQQSDAAPSEDPQNGSEGAVAASHDEFTQTDAAQQRTAALLDEAGENQGSTETIELGTGPSTTVVANRNGDDALLTLETESNDPSKHNQQLSENESVTVPSENRRAVELLEATPDSGKSGIGVPTERNESGRTSTLTEPVESAQHRNFELQQPSQQPGEITGEAGLGSEASVNVSPARASSQPDNAASAAATTLLSAGNTPPPEDGTGLTARHLGPPPTDAVELVQAASNEPSAGGVNSSVESPSGRAPVQFSTFVGTRENRLSDSPPVDQARFLQRVTKAFQVAHDRGGLIRLRLHPPELGSLRLEVRIEGNVLMTRIEAETPAARSLLLNNVAVLRERLAEQDIRVDQFDVDLLDRRSGGAEDGREQQQTTQDADTRDPRGEDPIAESTESDETTAERRPRDNGKIDVRV